MCLDTAATVLCFCPSVQMDKTQAPGVCEFGISVWLCLWIEAQVEGRKSETGYWLHARYVGELESSIGDLDLIRLLLEFLWELSFLLSIGFWSSDVLILLVCCFRRNFHCSIFHNFPNIWTNTRQWSLFNFHPIRTQFINSTKKPFKLNCPGIKFNFRFENSPSTVNYLSAGSVVWSLRRLWSRDYSSGSKISSLNSAHYAT